MHFGRQAWAQLAGCNQNIIEKDFFLSESEQNPDMTSCKFIEVLKARLLSTGAPAPVEASQQKGADLGMVNDLSALV